MKRIRITLLSRFGEVATRVVEVEDQSDLDDEVIDFVEDHFFDVGYTLTINEA